MQALTLRIAFILAAAAAWTLSAQCCDASADCASCNSGGYYDYCSAPIVPGETGCNCTSGGNCGCAKCCWSWKDSQGIQHQMCTSSNCNNQNQCLNRERCSSVLAQVFEIRNIAFYQNTGPTIEGARSGGSGERVEAQIYDDPASVLAIAAPRVLTRQGTLNALSVRVVNRGPGEVAAYQVFWVIETSSGSRPGATATSDLLLGEPLKPGQSEPITAFVGGIPASAIRSVTVRVSYYQLADGTVYNAGLTKAAEQFSQSRTAALTVFGRLHDAALSPGQDSAIRAVLFDRQLRSDPASQNLMNELASEYSSGGAQGLTRLVDLGLARLRGLQAGAKSRL